MQDKPPPPELTHIPDHQTEAVVVVGGDTTRGLVVLCDHATNAIPPEYGTLGLPAGALERHIAYDIGAAGLTLGLAERLGVPAVLSRFSRLLIDPNRGLDDPTVVMRIADGAIVEGNRHLDAAERDRRLARFHAPYHRAVAEVIAACRSTWREPVILSIHSFTPVWKGVPRSWQAGILWDKDPRLAVPLIEALRADPALAVGDNEPYDGALQGDTLWQHGTRLGLAHALVEVRQDLIATPQGQQDWAGRLAAIMIAILGAPDASVRLHRVEHWGSRTDIWPHEPAARGQP